MEQIREYLLKRNRYERIDSIQSTKDIDAEVAAMLADPVATAEVKPIDQDDGSLPPLTTSW